MGCSSGPVNPVGIEAPPGARKVFCVKLQRELPGLDEVPFEGHPLGQKIYENVSKAVSYTHLHRHFHHLQFQAGRHLHHCGHHAGIGLVLSLIHI